MDIESAFEVAGSFGRWQAFLFSIFIFMNMYGGWHMVLLVFVGAVPELNATNRGKTETLGMKTIVSEWNLFGDRAYIVNMIQSLFMFGVLIGNITLGQLSDRLGRKPVLFKAIFFHLVTSFIAGFSSDYRVFAFFRFLNGVCQGGLVLVMFVLQQELLGSKVWTITGSVPAAAFAVGIMELAGVASWMSDWQDLCIATSLPGILLCLSCFFIPESPRWLYSQGKVAEAEEVMRGLARKNGVSPSAVNSIVLQKKSETSSPNKSYSIIDLFSTSEIAKRTAIMAYTWFVCSFTYYGLTMAASDLGKNLHVSVALSGLVELPGYIVCVYFLSKPWSGRRRTMAVSLLIAGTSCGCIMFLPNPQDKSMMKTGFALIGKLCISAAFSTLYIYAAELFPTVIRNVGMGTSSMCARIGGMLAPMVPMLSLVFPSLPYVTYGLASLLAGVITFRLVETLNQKIPDTIDDISGSKRHSNYRGKSYSHGKEDKALLLDDDDEERL